MMSRLERKYRPRYRREIARAMAESARNQDNQALQAQVWITHRSNLKKILNANWNEAARLFGARVLEAAQKKEVRGAPSFFRAMARIISFIGGRRVTEITGTTQAQAQKAINDTITEVAESGAGERATAKILRDKINQLSSYRSQVIARTETATAANTANHQAAKATGLPLKKQWVTSIDGRERDTHKRANGQEVQLHQTFTVGRDRLMHPSDPSGEAKEVINCRCVEVVGL